MYERIRVNVNCACTPNKMTKINSFHFFCKLEMTAAKDANNNGPIYTVCHGRKPLLLLNHKKEIANKRSKKPTKELSFFNLKPTAIVMPKMTAPIAGSCGNNTSPIKFTKISTPTLNCSKKEASELFKYSSSAFH